MRHDPATILLYCLATQQELDLIAASGWLALPPHLPEQTAFYSALNEAYAVELVHDWNGPYYGGGGYVVRCAVDADYAAQFPVQHVGTQHHDELRVPAEALAEFNSHIYGQIEIVSLLGNEATGANE